jgi:hypothetical protein
MKATALQLNINNESIILISVHNSPGTIIHCTYIVIIEHDLDLIETGLNMAR